MKPLARCTTPLPTSNTSAANGNHPSQCGGGGDNDAITASPSSPSTSSSSAGNPRRVIRSRTRTRLRPRVLWAARGTAHDDLALPLGMSFAAVLSQVVEKNKQGERVSLSHFSKMCTSAVKESVTNE